MNKPQKSYKSGKIDVEGAEIQSLGESTIDVIIPELILEAKGHVRLESLSWMESIRRKHGLLEETTIQINETNTNDSNNKNNKNIWNQIPKIGRTASANQRALDLLKLSEIYQANNNIERENNKLK